MTEPATEPAATERTLEEQAEWWQKNGGTVPAELQKALADAAPAATQGAEPALVIADEIEAFAADED